MLPKPGRPWFRRRRIGIGWQPASWEGWLATALAVGGEIGVLAALRHTSARIPLAILIAALYTMLALVSGGRRAAEPVTALESGPETGAELERMASPLRARSTASAPPARREPQAPTGPPALVVEHLTKR